MKERPVNILLLLPGDKKFTNLKSPLFRKNYIEEES